MSANNFKQFDTGKTNMMDDATYDASTQRAGGVQTGVASSQLHNKLFYQLSTFVSAFGAMMSSKGIEIEDATSVDTYNDLVTKLGNILIFGEGGHTIKDEGSALTQRTNLNFTGSGVTVTDDSGNNASVVTIPATGGLITIYDAPGSGTYTVPTGTTTLKVAIFGAGGGGGISLPEAGGQTEATSGGYSKIVIAAVDIIAGGGTGGMSDSTVGDGGTISDSTVLPYLSLSHIGSAGAVGQNDGVSGGGGASGFFGGQNIATTPTVQTNGNDGNMGAGGGGGYSNQLAAPSGSGGGGGAYIELYVESPASSYSYTVGAGGTGGTWGGATHGGAGGNGAVIFECFS